MDYLALRAVAPPELEASFFELVAAAEAARPVESAAATRLQKAWRGRAVRGVLAFHGASALFVGRCVRGYIGRLRASERRRARDLERQRAFFDAFATAIQLRYRGFASRKYKHNFFARKAYVAAVLHKGEAVRRELQGRLEAQVSAKQEEQEATGRAKVSHLACKLHHLRSTASCYGLYASPYHVGYQPTAFGVPVEEHLRTAIRPVIRQELQARAKSIKPLQSLPPIKPHHSPGAYDATLDDERNERWLSKTKRVAQEDFVPMVGQSALRFPGSVHVGAGYHPPGNIEREVDKNKWVSKEPFVPAVPTNRIVSSAGTGKMGPL